MAENRRKFDQDSRDGAVRAVLDSGPPIAAVARHLGIGIGDGTLGNWVKWAGANSEPGALKEDERSELNRLRREVKELCMQREVLERSVVLEEWTGEPHVYAGDSPLNHSYPLSLFSWEAIAEGLGVGASCLIGPEMCVPVALGVIDYHVISADINSLETGYSPWPEGGPSLVAGGVSSLPFAGGVLAKTVWEALRRAFRAGASAGNAAGGLAGAATAESTSAGCVCP